MRYPKEFLPCKAWGHGLWQRYQPDPGEFKRAPEVGRYFFQLCTECGTIRYRNVNRISGEYLDSGWKYRAPDKYKPTQTISRQDYRRMYLNSRSLPSKHQSVHTTKTGTKLRVAS